MKLFYIKSVFIISILLVVFSTTLISSCTSGKQSSDDISIKGNKDTTCAKLIFDKYNHSFGRIHKNMHIVEFDFTFKNLGEIPAHVVSCNKKNFNCAETKTGCGLFYRLPCNAICKSVLS